MGYTTDFEGEFQVTPTLKPAHHAYLKAFGNTRRMARDAALAQTLPDPIREAAGLPIGPQGAFFVGGAGFSGQDQDISIVKHNDPADSQPGLWCQWVPGDSGDTIEWDENEKFYYYIEWLRYLITNFLKPWGYKLNGVVSWEGEGSHDTGEITVKDNVVSTGYDCDAH